MGIIVGLVVVGQILYNGTLEHVKEYGTLKAMGAKNGLVVGIILLQAMISAAVGFVVCRVSATRWRAGRRRACLSPAEPYATTKTCPPP